MTEEIDLLRSVALFKPLSDDVIEAFSPQVHEVTFAPGTRFITQGEVGRDAYLIAEGEVEVSFHGRHVASHGRGELIGEIAAVDSRPRTASISAKTRVRALVLTGELLRGLMRDHPNFAAVIARAMSARAPV